MFNLETKKEIFIPEKCKRCKYYIKNKPDVIGIKIQTPFSYIMVKGCISDIPCEEKNQQIIFYGIGVDTKELGSILGELLIGRRELKDRNKLIDLIEVFSGAKLNHSEKVKPDLPPVVEKFVKALIGAELPCRFSYPLVGFSNPELVFDPINIIGVVLHPLPASPEEMFGLWVEYSHVESVVCKIFIYVIKTRGAELYKPITFFSKMDDLGLLVKADKYLLMFLEMITQGNENLKKIIKVGQLCSKYLRQYAVHMSLINTNKKRG